MTRREDMVEWALRYPFVLGYIRGALSMGLMDGRNMELFDLLEEAYVMYEKDTIIHNGLGDQVARGMTLTLPSGG